MTLRTRTEQRVLEIWRHQGTIERDGLPKVVQVLRYDRTWYWFVAMLFDGTVLLFDASPVDVSLMQTEPTPAQWRRAEQLIETAVLHDHRIQPRYCFDKRAVG